MKIIDKNTDFYDFWQGVYRDDSIVFDRTDSFVLTKELMCKYLYRSRFLPSENHFFVLLQVCNRFWLFFLEITKKIDGIPKDYTIELVKSWENYGKPRCLEKLDIVRFGVGVDHILCNYKGTGKWQHDREKIMCRADTLSDSIDRNDYDTERSINKHTIYRDDNAKTEKHIPLLKACGIAGCVDPLEIYLAFEKYFSMEKTASERTESVGLTDQEKISNHGFDLKQSFRGKMSDNE